MRAAERGGLDLFSLRAAAERATGLSDWGGADRWSSAAERLIASFAEESNLGPAGRLGAALYLTAALCNRLLIQRYLCQRSAALASVPLHGPLFILGLPRSGTTLLHNTLSLHPEVATLTSTDVFHPTGEAAGGLTAVQATARILDAWNRTVPALRAIHAMSPEMPNECGFLQQNTYVAHYFSLIGRVPSYVEWLGGLSDLDEETEYLRLQYRIIADRRAASGRWVYKCPHHVFGLRSLLRAFPDCKVIWTHRDIREAVPSFCSLVSACRGRYGRGARDAAIGPEEVSVWSLGVREALAVRKTAPAGRFLDVDYRRIVSDLPGVVAEICRFAGLKSDAQTLAQISSGQRAHPRHRHGIHRYTASDFGLSEEDISSAFTGYRGVID